MQMNMQVRRFSIVMTVLTVIIATIMGVSVSRAATAPIKIMPVGDSVTAGIGSTGNGAYRTNLYTAYTNAGISFDFVGSQSGGPSSLPDKNHEGHSGWTISQIASNVNNWLNTYNPDVMLLMIGGNDTLAGTVPTSALSSLIDQITNQKPNLHLFVADYYYSLPSNQNYQLIVQYDAAIPGIVQQKANAGKHVYFVKLSDAQLATSEYADGLHPTDSGYSKLAAIWNRDTTSIIQSLVGGATPTRTNTPATGPTNTPTRIFTPGGPTPTNTVGASNTPSAFGNILTNADMENSTTNWVVNGAGTLSSDTTQFHGGVRSVKTTGRTASWNGIGQNVAVSNFPTSGQSYTASIWVRSQTGTPSAKVTLRLTAGTTTYVTLATTAINSTGWTLVTGTGPVSWSGTLTGVLFYVETVAGTDNLYIDDASLSSGAASPTATPTRTFTPGAPTNTPTNTPVGPTNTPIPGSGGACSPVTSTISSPFTYDGAGTFCWQSTNLGAYINSWNANSIMLNGINVTNLYVASGSYPAKIGGYWYVSYNSSVAWSHFEAK
jgi:lysophospholipase L1-like esterase